jgi:hypothetical protein
MLSLATLSIYYKITAQVYLSARIHKYEVDISFPATLLQSIVVQVL